MDKKRYVEEYLEYFVLEMDKESPSPNAELKGKGVDEEEIKK